MDKPKLTPQQQLVLNASSSLSTKAIAEMTKRSEKWVTETLRTAERRSGRGYHP